MTFSFCAKSHWSCTEVWPRHLDRNLQVFSNPTSTTESRKASDRIRSDHVPSRLPLLPFSAEVKLEGSSYLKGPWVTSKAPNAEKGMIYTLRLRAGIRENKTSPPVRWQCDGQRHGLILLSSTPGLHYTYIGTRLHFQQPRTCFLSPVT